LAAIAPKENKFDWRISHDHLRGIGSVDLLLHQEIYTGDLNHGHFAADSIHNSCED